MAKWMLTAKRADFTHIAETFGISPVLARLIRNRDVVGDDNIRRYLSGGLGDLHDPALLPDADKAARLLERELALGHRIRVIGDYDVDGICASYILVTLIREMGGQADARLPDRVGDGYGINERLVREAAADGADMIMTCDNGIAASGPLALARDLGMTTLVTDHHEVPFEMDEKGEKTYILPEADAVVDPKVPGSAYPFPDICGAVVAWKLAGLLLERTGHPERDRILKDLLPFAGIATVCDVMPLQDENRILVREGLEAAASSDNPGLKALITVSGLAGAPLTCYHAGFILGPCLNATGRLDCAERGLALFMETDQDRALSMAQELKQLNDSRKDMTRKGTMEAVRRVEEEGLIRDRILVLYLEDCHESLAGIIAGRVRERFSRPAVVLTGVEGGLAKGSGRSVEAYDMFESFSACRDLFIKFGGHRMAAGLTIEKEKIGAFRRRVNEACALTEDDLQDVVRIDMELPPRFLDLAMVRSFKALEPCGVGNARPLFAARNMILYAARVLGRNQNVIRFEGMDETGSLYTLMWFGEPASFAEIYAGGTADPAWTALLQGRGNSRVTIVYYPEINVWQGRESLQLIIRDRKPAP